MAGERTDGRREVPGESGGVDHRAVANARGAVGVVRAASETVDDRLATIDERTSAQAEDVDRVVTEVSDLSATIEEVAASAEEVAQRSEDAAKRATGGREAAADAMDVMQSVRETSEELATVVGRLEERIDTIDRALSGIDEIADQTNMLALNASIEAARAGSGDGGGSTEGFAVVAEEIKSLAAESQEQADTIETALAEVRTATDETVEQLDRTTERIEAGADHVASAMDELDAVAGAVDRTAEDIQAVSVATDDLADSGEAIATQSERVRERATDIEGAIAEIREARAEQTAMLREAEEALGAAVPDAGDRRRIPTDVSAVDTHCGGFLEGGQAVVQHDGETTVDDLIGAAVVAALADGRTVSLTPTPTLDRETLAAAFDGADDTLVDVLREDRLFVLDAFGTWQPGDGVFDLSARSLGDVNRETDRRRDAPLLVVGNVAGEIAVLGERRAREARYENDDGVFGGDDTVVNVVDESTVPDDLGAFYLGAADQVVRVERSGGRRRLTIARSPDLADDVTAALDGTRATGRRPNR
jgi:uncharacterized protein YoxC